MLADGGCELAELPWCGGAFEMRMGGATDGGSGGGAERSGGGGGSGGGTERGASKSSSAIGVGAMVGASSSSTAPILFMFGWAVAMGVKAVGVSGRTSGGRGGSGACGIMGCGRVSSAACGGVDFLLVVESESESAGGGCDADDGAFFWVTLISAPVLACRHVRRHITMRSWSGPRSIVTA